MEGSNPIYNLLPDILGKLSNPDLKRDVFCSIMQFLICSIKKDKQMEALVEKLCNRFSGVADIKQWEYISYCLSQLTFTEKGLKKLMESFKTYEHALSEDSVMENFRSIINKGKKFAKPEVKACIDEFEEKLNKFHVEKKEQEVTARNAEIHQKKVGREDCVEDTEDGEVIDPSTERMTEANDEVTGSKCENAVESSGICSEVTEAEPDDGEVQSPFINQKGGAAKSRAKKSNIKDQKGDDNIPSIRKSMRKKR